MHPVALALETKDLGVFEEAIENRGGRGDVAQELTPVLGGSVGGDEGRRLLVTSDEDLQQILGRVGTELAHTEILEREEIDPDELIDEFAASVGGARLEEVLRKIEGVLDQDAVSRPDRTHGDGGDGVALADSRRADQENPLMLSDEASGGEFAESSSGELGIEGPVEVGELLDLGDARLFQAAGEEAVTPAVHLILDEKLQEVAVWQSRARGLLEPDGKRFGHAGEAQVS